MRKSKTPNPSHLGRGLFNFTFSVRTPYATVRLG